MTKLTILGSGSANLRPERAGASVFVEHDSVNFVYDFGRGVALRLVELGLRQDDIRHIVISHFHPDHATDLLPFLHAASWSQIDKRTAPLTIYGPAGIKEYIEKLLLPYEARELSRGFSIDIVEVADSLEIDGREMPFVDLHHSHGIDLGPIAIAGDASFHPTLVDFLKARELIVFSAGHLSDAEIVQLAVESQAKRMVCSHLYRELDENMLNREAIANGYRGQLIIAQDLMELKH